MSTTLTTTTTEPKAAAAATTAPTPTVNHRKRKAGVEIISIDSDVDDDKASLSTSRGGEGEGRPVASATAVAEPEKSETLLLRRPRKHLRIQIADSRTSSNRVDATTVGIHPSLLSKETDTAVDNRNGAASSSSRPGVVRPFELKPDESSVVRQAFGAQDERFRMSLHWSAPTQATIWVESETEMRIVDVECDLSKILAARDKKVLCLPEGMPTRHHQLRYTAVPKVRCLKGATSAAGRLRMVTDISELRGEVSWFPSAPNSIRIVVHKMIAPTTTTVAVVASASSTTTTSTVQKWSEYMTAVVPIVWNPVGRRGVDKTSQEKEDVVKATSAGSSAVDSR